MKKQILNLTGHEVRILDTVIPVHGNIRLSQSSIITGEINWIPVSTIEYWGVALPAPDKNKVYVVWLLICQLNPERSDLYIPAGKDKWNMCHSLCLNPFYIVPKVSWK